MEKQSWNADKTQKYTNCAIPSELPFDHKEDEEARSEWHVWVAASACVSLGLYWNHITYTR